MSTVAPFKVTSDDLEGLDKKTRDGLGPLLDPLNTTIQQLVSALNTQPTSKTYDTTFVSESTGTAYVTLVPPVGKPRSVQLDQLALNGGGDIASLYSWSWQQIGANVRLLFVGLDMGTKYNLRVTIT